MCPIEHDNICCHSMQVGWLSMLPSPVVPLYTRVLCSRLTLNPSACSSDMALVNPSTWVYTWWGGGVEGEW